jgi:hypothetical protein
VTKPATKPITLCAPASIVARIEAYAAKYPLLSQHRLALLALSRGLDAMDGDPRWFEKTAKEQ